jgi:hypothetical protein
MIPRSAWRLAWAQRIAAALVVLFWISFAGEFRQLPAAIVDFEWSFVVPDLLWIVVPFLFASHWLLTGNRKGRAAAGVAGGAMFYLGLLDVAYNVRHGQYSTTRGFLDAAVNLACLLFGAVNIRFGLGGG